MSNLNELKELILICPSQSVFELVEAYLGRDGASPRKEANNSPHSLPQETPCSLFVREAQVQELFLTCGCNSRLISHGNSQISLGMSTNKVGRSAPQGTPDFIECNNCDANSVSSAELKLKSNSILEKEGAVVACTHGQRPRYSFESEGSLEEIGLGKSSDIECQKVSQDNKENIRGLSEIVNRLTLAEGGSKGHRDDLSYGSTERSARGGAEISKWPEIFSERRNHTGAIIAYSKACAHEVRSAIISYCLTEASSIESTGDALAIEEKTDDRKYIVPTLQNRGNVLVVTSKEAIGMWEEVVNFVDCHLRIVDYSVPARRRRGLRINSHSADVVLTTWDVLKSREVDIRGEGCNYCHTFPWACIVVDYHANRMPSRRNQAGLAIQALKSISSRYSGTSSASHHANIKASLVQVRDEEDSILRSFVPTVASLGGLRGNIAESYFDTR